MNTKVLLLLGPRTNLKNPAKTGGVIVLFEELLRYCEKNDIIYKVIDTNKANYPNIVFAYIMIWYQLLVLSRKSHHISVHGTSNDYLYIAPFALLVSKLFTKSLSLRKFGGNFIELYENYSFLKQFIIRIILGYADYSFFETKYLVKYFKKYNKKTFWFPNVRTKKLKAILPRHFHKRFVFISHIRKSKGIDEILEASQGLDNSYTIDIYGPIIKDYKQNDFVNYANISYKGALLSSDVLKTLNTYDVLLLPSYQEGYPGIIIEAFSLGIPVIATDLEAISEVIDDHKNGLLVPVANSQQLRMSIEYINESNYQDMSYFAYKSFDHFDSDTVTKGYINHVIV